MRTLKKLAAFFLINILFLFPGSAFSQEKSENTGNAENTIKASRGSIPEELLRPHRNEAPRYPVDTVIGVLGQGQATAEAYTFARKIAENLLKGNAEAESLKAMNKANLGNYMSLLEEIGARSFRIGGGREEKDGAISFLTRFIGRELAITGELYIRKETRFNENNSPVGAVWIFEDLILEDAQSRKEENDKSEQRFDFTPYHRFY